MFPSHSGYKHVHQIWDERSFRNTTWAATASNAASKSSGLPHTDNEMLQSQRWHRWHLLKVMGQDQSHGSTLQQRGLETSSHNVCRSQRLRNIEWSSLTPPISCGNLPWVVNSGAQFWEMLDGFVFPVDNFSTVTKHPLREEHAGRKSMWGLRMSYGDSCHFCLWFGFQIFFFLMDDIC